MIRWTIRLIKEAIHSSDYLINLFKLGCMKMIEK